MRIFYVMFLVIAILFTNVMAMEPPVMDDTQFTRHLRVESRKKGSSLSTLTNFKELASGLKAKSNSNVVSKQYSSPGKFARANEYLFKKYIRLMSWGTHEAAVAKEVKAKYGDRAVAWLVSPLKKDYGDKKLWDATTKAKELENAKKISTS